MSFLPPRWPMRGFGWPLSGFVVWFASPSGSCPWGAVRSTPGLLRWATPGGHRVRARAHLLPPWPWGHPLPCQVSSAEPAGGWLCSRTCRERFLMASGPLIGRNGSPPLGDRQSCSRRGRLGAPAGRGWAVMLQVGTSLGAPRITWKTLLLTQTQRPTPQDFESQWL